MKYYILIFVILIKFLAIPTSAQNKQLRFERIGIKEGLSDPIVLSMLQDSRGFLWVGTRRGLNRYDGNQFKTFFNIREDSTSISGNYINKIIEDSKGTLWIATADGLNRFDRYKNIFKQYINEPNNSYSLSGDNASNIIEDKLGRLWITTNDGVNILNPETGRFTRFMHDKNDSTSLSDNFATSVLCDSNGDIWIGTINGGLNKFVPTDSTFIHYKTDNRNSEAISGNSISTIFEDSQKRLWIGTSNTGLNILDRKKGKFQHFHPETNDNSISGNNVLCLNEDDSGNLLIGVENGGICFLDSSLQKFTNYVHDDIDESSLSANSVYSILDDNVGNIWVGVFAGGLNLYKKSTASFNHFKHTSSKNSISNNFVLGIYEDHDENIWIGTDGGGLNCFDQKTGKSYLYIQNSLQNSIAGNSIITMNEDGKHNLWIGTWGNGLSKLNLNTRKFTNFNIENTQQGLSSNNIYSIKVARDGKVWIGTFGGGLDIYDEKSNSFTHFQNDKNDKNSLSDNMIYTILEDKEGNMWLGTAHGGINLFDPKTKSFIRFDEEHNNLIVRNIYHLIQSSTGTIYACTAGYGLIYFDQATKKFHQIESKNNFASEFVYAALEDFDGKIWMSSNQGISSYDPKSKTVKNYTVEDGLQADEYKPHSAFITKSGMLYFGGINGYNSFYPGQIRKKSYNSPIVLTDLKLFNKSVPIAQNENDPSPLKQDISETKSLRLKYNQSFITFEFASLDFSNSDEKAYSYMLEGFDEEWNNVVNKNSATYTNLNPGEYIFKVKSQNSSGEWSSQILQLNVTIVPPFWLTWWFKLLMGMFLIIAPIGLTYFRIKQLNKQKVLLEKSVDERTAEIQSKNQLLNEQALTLLQKNDQLNDLNSTKDKLFSIIGHDLRTPFSAILGFQDLLVNSYNDYSDKERLNMITQTHSTTNQVYALVENLLSWARIQSNTIQHKPISKNIKLIINEKLQLYQDIAKGKGISLNYQIPDDLVAFADVNLIDTILRNLISNAIKFTPNGGNILVTACQINDFIKISIIDSGIGMDQEQIDNLYKLDKTQSKQGTNGEIGSGLGLVLCKELAEKNGGVIIVESIKDIGTTLSFTIPTTPTRQTQYHQRPV
jgi:signal transduction histidine kinase/ligand-binding sensor domain-containing protein